MKKTDIKMPKMLKEVWLMKNRLYIKTKDLNCKGYFKYINSFTK